MLYSSYFIWQVRQDDSEYVTYTEGAPEQLKEFVRTVHKDVFGACTSDDWIYETIYDAFLDLESLPLDQIQIESDLYNNKLLEWLRVPSAENFCDEVLQEGLCTKFFEVIMVAQVKAKYAIYEQVSMFLSSNDERI